MPLDSTAMGRIFLSALSALANPSGEHRPYQLALALNTRYNLVPEEYGFGSEQSLFNAVWNVVRQAAGSFGSAGVLNTDPSRAITPPRVPGISPDAPEYSYRVVAEIRYADGSRATTAFDVRSDTALSGEDIWARATEQLQNTVPDRGTSEGRRRIQSDMASHSVDIIVLSAGRR